MVSIAQELEKYTASISNFDTARDYISMSHAGLELEEMIKTIDQGFTDSLDIRLRCYKGYQMERDLKRRILDLYGDRIKTDVEYKAFNGIVMGHPDFEFDGYPGDCKTVPLQDHLPENAKRVSRKIYYQMQCYMLYCRVEKAVVIFEARDTGRLRDYWFDSNSTVMGYIDNKYRQAVQYWNSVKGVPSA